MSTNSKTICDGCGKKEKNPVHWAHLAYAGSYGGNDGAGPCTVITSGSYDLCVDCKRKLFALVLKHNGEVDES